MSAEIAATAEPLPAEPALRFVRRKKLVRLVLVTTLLNLVSLFFYRFWARTRWRQHIWGSVLLRGDPLAYHGTGLEMFKGFLVALAVVAPALIALNFSGDVLGGAVPYVTFAVIVVLSAMAKFFAWRYRASRTSWRGVHFRVEGGFWQYARGAFAAALILLLSGAIFYPHCRVLLRARLLSATALGDRKFECNVRLWPLYKYWLVVWIGLAGVGLWFSQYLPVFQKASEISKPALNAALEAASFWPLAVLLTFAAVGMVAYRVAEFRAIAAGLTLGEVRFVSRARAIRIGGSIAIGALAFFGVIILLTAVLIGAIWAFVSIVAPGELTANVGQQIALNFAFAVFFSLPVYLAFAVVRWAWITPWIIQHLVSTLEVENAGSLDSVVAGAADTLTRGEGLADSFDVGLA